MAKKKKKVVWHKKREKFLSSSVLRPHGSDDKSAKQNSPQDKKKERMKVFAKDLSSQIKKAVRNKS